MSQTITTERRACRPRTNMTVEELIRSNVESARHQLSEARENLIAARRRVVALEGAVENWIEMAELAMANARQSA